MTLNQFPFQVFKLCLGCKSPQPSPSKIGSSVPRKFSPRKFQQNFVLEHPNAGIYANLSFKQYQKELKKLTRLVIVVHISYDQTYGYSWKIHQWTSTQNFSIFYPFFSSLYRQYHSVLKHYPCLTIVMLTRKQFH